MAGWSKLPTLFIDQVEDDLVAHQKEIVTDLMDEITSRAPIESGQYMANNVVSIGSPDYGVTRNLDTLGTSTRGAALAALANLKPYSLIYIQNNSVYGEIIEFGGYKGPSIKVNEQGYSRMAPKGVYGLSFISVTEALK